MSDTGGAAPGVTNLVYLPMIYLGGLFIPLPAFSAEMGTRRGRLSSAAGRRCCCGCQPIPVPAAADGAAVLVGVVVLFGGLAIRRLARIG
jgi:ABC-2 type transport system permease protein